MFILPTLKQNLMHYLPYTNSRCLPNAPKRFGALRRSSAPSSGSATSTVNFSKYVTSNSYLKQFEVLKVNSRDGIP